MSNLGTHTMPLVCGVGTSGVRSFEITVSFEYDCDNRLFFA